jgi:hypothetical protein
VRKLFLLAGITTSAVGAYLLTRAREIADEEGRPLADVLVEMPGRIVSDLSTIGDDLHEAADEGRIAADEAAKEFDEEIGEPEI